MSVSFDSYKVFYIVVKNGSITSAAKELFVTQPTVTHCIQKLEEDLDCTLFIRGKKGVELTPEGKALYKHIKIACEEIWRAENYMEELKKFEKGKIILGASEMTLHHFLIPNLKKFKKLYPQIKMKIYNANATNIITMIKENKIECGLSAFPSGYKEEGLVIKELDTFQDIVIVGNGYKELAGKKVSLQQLEKYPFVGLENSTLTSFAVKKLLTKYNINFNPDIELATSDLIVPIVASDLGIGFVPEAFAEEALRKKQVYKLDIIEEIPKRSICLIYKSEKPLSIAVEAFMKCIQTF